MTLRGPSSPLRHPAAAERGNSTHRRFPRDATLVDLLDAAETTYRDLPAVRTPEGVRLTHGELGARSTGLARRLAALGVGRGTPVAVLADHVPAAVVAFHAVIRAGAHYVPLDDRWPAQRMAGIVESMSVPVLVASADFEQAALEVGRRTGTGTLVLLDPEGGAAAGGSAAADGQDPWRVVRLAGGAPDRPRRLAGAVAASARPEATDLAYTLFTSGSTGVPKGVEVTHRSVVNLVDWFNRRNGVGPDDVLLQTAAFGFDLSVYDLFGLIAAGGSLLLLPGRELAEPRAVADALTEHRVTLWNSAPAAFTLVLMFAAETRHRGGALRRVFLSGDWIPLDLPSALESTFPGAVLVALGGATEACVWSNDFVVTGVDPAWRSIPYGHPMQNCRYYVLRDDMSPCDLGEAGELYIAGECVAAGYANDPETTRARFLPDPWAPGAGGRMYRTGDRARWTPDGWVEFLGRLDSQVKVRGYRIELGEVEHAARQVAGVEEAAAVVVGDPRDPVLAVAVRTREPMDGRNLTRELAALLPAYMVPTRTHIARSLPVGPNGKVDRNVLRRLLTGPVRDAKAMR
ncbi:amino acid adenylation domain-containing protein [Actinacidiphila yeochonensis]|uniref:amino acid adenylation domain-containing protein n=1 Tax=Actinacidiphila yeochonensis TaxID=89050 RepID=UPI0006921CAD|nr:amino acid adenylation domain-containing protein [Actinacidiphila yeochonensis]